MNKTTPQLNQEEIKLLQTIKNNEWQSIPNLPSEQKRHQLLAQKFLTKKKTISLRLNATTLERLKLKSLQLGMPYQTLISSILHQYTTGQTITP